MHSSISTSLGLSDGGGGFLSILPLVINTSFGRRNSDTPGIFDNDGMARESARFSAVSTGLRIYAVLFICCPCFLERFSIGSCDIHAPGLELRGVSFCNAFIIPVWIYSASAIFHPDEKNAVKPISNND